MLVALVVLAEFGAFEILGFNTLTTEIYTEFTVGLNQTAACALSLILVVLGIVILLGEGAARGHGRGARLGAGAARRIRPQPLGRAMPAVLGGVGGARRPGPGGARRLHHLPHRAGRELDLAACLLVERGRRTRSRTPPSAGVIATVAALPIALLSVRYPRREVRFLERSNMLILAVPGLVIALSATYFTEHLLAGFLYQTPLLLVLVYAVMFFPMAVVSVRAAVARSPVGLEEVGHSLGVRRGAVFWRVTLPLIGPGLVAAFCLVFLESAIELTATLVLHPDRRADAGHPVLGVPDRSLLQPGRALRRRDHVDRRRSQLRPGPLVRPPACPHGERAGGGTGGPGAPGAGTQAVALAPGTMVSL